MKSDLHISPAKLVLLAAAAAMLASGCGNRRDRVVESAGPEELYERGTASMRSGNYPTALAYYQQLEARYPFSNVTRQAQLDMIYVYYRARQRSRPSMPPTNSSRRTPPTPAWTTACT